MIAEDADEINRVGEALVREIQEQSEAQREQVTESAAAEQQEVGEPARKAEQDARRASDMLESRGAGSGHFSEPLSEAASVSREIERLFGETAEESEEHQREAKGETERLHADVSSTASQRRKV